MTDEFPKSLTDLSRESEENRLSELELFELDVEVRLAHCPPTERKAYLLQLLGPNPEQWGEGHYPDWWVRRQEEARAWRRSRFPGDADE